MIARERSLHYIPKLLPIPVGRRPARVYFGSAKDARDRYEHEIATARLMTRFGYDVRFIEASRQVNKRTADCMWNGKEWELKMIKGNDYRTVARAFIAATKQCDRIILDVRWTSRGALQVARDIMNEAKKRKGRVNFTEVWVLDKDYYCVVRKDMIK